MAKAKKKTAKCVPSKVQPPARPPEFNLATEKGMKGFRDYGEGFDSYEYHCDFLRFLETLEKPPLRWNTMPIFLGNKEDFRGDVCLIQKGRSFQIVWRRPEEIKAGMNGKVPAECTEPPLIFLVDCDRRTPETKAYRLIPLLCGDDDDENGVVAGLEGYGFPAISFRCLSHFYDDDFKGMVRLVDQGNLRVLDFTPDETMELRKSDKEKLKKIRRKLSRQTGDLFALVAGIKPPKPGFTMLNPSDARRACWHRTGTVLLTDGKQYILMGRDGDQYFGCELPDACSTISEAMVMLVPPEAVGCQRQGEWFAVPVNKEAVPAPQDCVLCFEISCDGYHGHHEDVFLPLEDVDSNKHYFSDGEGRVGRDGVLYVRSPSLAHDEHEELNPGNGWFTFIKNTAVRSFSEGGVD